MPYALSGNMAVTREAFDKVGGFTEDLGTVGEDVDLSWKLQLAGYRLHFEPSAVIAYRHRHDLRGLWRTNVDFGMADPELFRRFRSYGFPPLRPASMAAAYFRLIVHLPRLFSARSRGQWVREAAKRWGRLRGSLRSRALYL
jgi:GT2 family glycosyltransferase